MPLLNTAQAAALCNCSQRTIRRQAASGKITGIRVGRDWVFSEDYIQGLVAGSTVDVTSNENTSGSEPEAELS